MLIPTPPGTPAKQHYPPKTVIAVQPVTMALVQYTDDSGREISQLALVGDNNVHLLESRELGLSQERTPQGRANSWLSEGVFTKIKGL